MRGDQPCRTGGWSVKAVVAASREPGDSRDEEVCELYVAYRKGVRAYLINSVGCPEHEADDVLQDTILIVRDRWDQIRSLESPQPTGTRLPAEGPRGCGGSGLGAVVTAIPMIFCAPCRHSMIRAGALTYVRH
jgi:hypothetical protein